MRLADDGHHIVLAMALEADVIHDDHLVVAFHFGERARQYLHRIFEVASKEFLVGAHDAGQGVEQPFAVRVFGRVRQEVRKP